MKVNNSTHFFCGAILRIQQLQRLDPHCTRNSLLAKIVPGSTELFFFVLHYWNTLHILVTIIKLFINLALRYSFEFVHTFLRSFRDTCLSMEFVCVHTAT